jgi:hypothetical protein
LLVQTSTLFLPYDIGSMTGIVSGLNGVFGRSQANSDYTVVQQVTPAVGAAVPPPAVKGRRADAFPDLN